MTAKDWHGREIKVGDTVRKAYEPWPISDSPPPGRGYHAHYFAGTAKVTEIHGGCVVLDRCAGASSVFLGALLEVVTEENRERGYIVPLAGPYRLPPR